MKAHERVVAAVRRVAQLRLWCERRKREGHSRGAPRLEACGCEWVRRGAAAAGIGRHWLGAAAVPGAASVVVGARKQPRHAQRVVAAVGHVAQLRSQSVLGGGERGGGWRLSESARVVAAVGRVAQLQILRGEAVGREEWVQTHEYCKQKRMSRGRGRPCRPAAVVVCAARQVVREQQRGPAGGREG